MKAKLGPIHDEVLLQVKVAIPEAENEKITEKESELEKLKLDEQNYVLQQKHLQIRLMQLEEQLLQRNKELQKAGGSGEENERKENKNK